jgi:pimeloyl-ACP methyl ester carboxylesterase
MRRFLVFVLVLLAGVAFMPPLLTPLLGLGPDPALLPSPGRHVSLADGTVLSVTEAGAGDPVVFVHGLPGSASDWGTVPAQLAALGYRTIVYDRAGYGFSSRPPETPDHYTLTSNARDLAGLLAALGIERATLVGWSYGGGIVQTLAVESPQLLSHLVLLSSVGPLEIADPEGEPLASRLVRSPIALPLFDWVRNVPPLARAITHDGLVKAFTDGAVIPRGYEERTEALLALPGALRSYVLEEQRFDQRTLRPEAITAPALVLQGSDDLLVKPAVGEDLAKRLPNSRLVVVPIGSHMLPQTDPDQVVRRIHEFLISGESPQTAASG